LQTGIRQPQNMPGIMCLSGYLPLATVVGNERNEVGLSTPIFMAHGRQDHVVPFLRAEQSRDALQAMGYQVEWHAYQMQHSLCLEEVQDISKWIRKVLS